MLFCIVYPLRVRGAKQARVALSDGERRGWLTVLGMAAGQPVRVARLLDQGGQELLPELMNANVRLVDHGGLLIDGFESSCRQTWWCVPLAPHPRGLQPPNTDHMPWMKRASVGRRV